MSWFTDSVLTSSGWASLNDLISCLQCFLLQGTRMWSLCNGRQSGATAVGSAERCVAFSVFRVNMTVSSCRLPEEIEFKVKISFHKIRKSQHLSCPFYPSLHPLMRHRSGSDPIRAESSGGPWGWRWRVKSTRESGRSWRSSWQSVKRIRWAWATDSSLVESGTVQQTALALFGFVWFSIKSSLCPLLFMGFVGIRNMGWWLISLKSFEVLWNKHGTVSWNAARPCLVWMQNWRQRLKAPAVTMTFTMWSMFFTCLFKKDFMKTCLPTSLLQLKRPISPDAIVLVQKVNQTSKHVKTFCFPYDALKRISGNFYVKQSQAVIGKTFVWLLFQWQAFSKYSETRRKIVRKVPK